MLRLVPLFKVIVVFLGSTHLTNSITTAQDSSRRRAPDPDKVHDPSTIVLEAGVYRSLCTGRGIKVLREDDKGNWLTEGRLFEQEELPGWHRELVPENQGHLWAPDVVKLEHTYFVYYSVSSFGKNTSAIGLAVGKTLDPNSQDWAWEDRGPVIVSRKTDRFNAIDPAIYHEPETGNLVMTFGSFWDGIFMIRLDPKTGLRPAENADQGPVHLAKTAEIEAPFLCKGPNRDYFLFVNWGRCCRGVASTYEIRVGRSKTLEGPYLDREGRDLRKEGGTLVLESHGRFIGPGHASILNRESGEWLVHHFYDGANRGRSRLRMLPLEWDALGWPVLAQSDTGSENLSVEMSVDISSTQGPLEPIWRFFGADEPNYAYMKDGKKLLGQLGQLRPNQVFFRTHNLMTTGPGAPALKWGSSNLYTEDANGDPIYDFKIVDLIFDTYRERGVRPYVQLGFMPKALSTKPEPYKHTWRPGMPYNDIYTGWAYPPKDYEKWGEVVYQWARHCVGRYGMEEVENLLQHSRRPWPGLQAREGQLQRGSSACNAGLPWG